MQQPEANNQNVTPEIMQRRFDRERRARQQAETALEHKSLELFRANEQLRVANQRLQGQVQEQETARRESEARAGQIVDTALDAVVAMDDQGKIIGWNAQAMRTFGWSVEEAMGKAFAELVAVCDRDSSNPVGITLPTGAMKEAGEEWFGGKRMEITALHRSGREFAAEAAISMLPSPAGATFSAFVRDITHAKDADQRRDTLYKVTRVLAESAAIDTAVVEILQAICQGMGWVLGCAWRVDSGKKLLVCQAEWHEAQGVAAFAEACRNATFGPGIGLPGRIWSSGAPAWIYNVGTEENFPRRPVATLVGVRTGFGFPVKLGDKVIGVMEFFRVQARDCDSELLSLLQVLGSQIGQFMQRRLAEQEARNSRAQAERARAEAERASAAKSEFLANMSHELRTPLNGVVGMVDLLLTANPTDKQRKYCEVARTSARALLELINDILDFSKIEAGKLELEFSDFDLSELISGVGMMLSPRAQAKDLTLNCSAAADVPAWVIGDSLRLRQILVNLVNNAVKFTERGGVQVQGSLVESTKTDVLLRFEVRDTGPGIPADRLNQLFKSFTQVDASTSRRHGGTGLGLAISKRLVELMGGQIGVESQEGKGSTFWFTARLRRSAMKKTDAPQTQAAQKLDGVRVLVAEDNEFNQLVASELLTQIGCKVTLVNDGKEAVSSALANEYDVILMDCQMPEVDGFEATRRIREHEKVTGGHRPIIALTASAIKGDREQCLAAGMDDYVTKPIEWRALSAAIAAQLPAAARAAKASEVSEKDQKTLPAIDVNSLLERCGGNNALVQKLLGKFDEQIRILLENIRKDFKPGMVATGTAARTAHTIKGMAGNMSAEPLRTAAAEIEASLATSHIDDATRQLEILEKRVRECLDCLPGVRMELEHLRVG